MPRLSSEEGTATLSSWLVAPGDIVAQGALIAELETDKATVELEAPVAGRIESLQVAAGTEGLKPGVELGWIVPEETGAAAGAGGPAAAERANDEPARGERAAAAPDAAAPAEAEPTGVDAESGDASGRSSATPLARRLAASQGIDLGRVKGTGVGGRIGKADVERSVEAGAGHEGEQAAARHAASEATEATRPAEAVASTGAIASEATAPLRPPAQLARAAGEAPRAAVHLKLRCRMEAAVAVRARLNEVAAAAGGVAHVTLNDLVLLAAARALRDVPEANLQPAAQGDPDRAGGSDRRHPGVDLAVVVATGSGSAVVVVRDADRKGLAVLSAELRSRAEALRAGGSVDEEVGASLLVTSFARFGIESAHPMLPPGQVAVLAVGGLVEEPVVRDGAVAIGARMALTLAFDPTRVGGAVMGQLLAAVRDHLEDPLGMVL